MKCPYCGKEMISGVVQSARQVFFTTKAHKFCFAPDSKRSDEVYYVLTIGSLQFLLLPIIVQTVRKWLLIIRKNKIQFIR